MIDEGIRITVNADDYGHSVERTDGIIKAFQMGLIDRTTIMVNMPDCERAVELAFRLGLQDKVGLHLTLTEGRPLTTPILSCSNLTKNGEFWHLNSYLRRHKLTREEKDALREEISAQIEKYLSFRLPLMHIDSHHNIHHEKQVFDILLPLANDFKSMRIGRNLMGKDLKSCIKLVYKYFLNHKIRKHFDTTDYFGSFNDYHKYWKHNGTVEIMVHPEIHDGIVLDRVGSDTYISMEEYKMLINKDK